MPSDLVAATTPSIVERRDSGTARAQAVMQRDDAVQDSAMPIRPPDTASDMAPVAVAITVIPAA